MAGEVHVATEGHIATVQAVVDHDDVRFAEYTVPPLTTVRIDRRTLGMKTVDLLMRRIEGSSPSSEVIETALVIRGSTMRIGSRSEIDHAPG